MHNRLTDAQDSMNRNDMRRYEATVADAFDKIVPVSDLSSDWFENSLTDNSGSQVKGAL